MLRDERVKRRQEGEERMGRRKDWEEMFQRK